MTDYPALGDALKSLVSGVPHFTANLANASSLLYHTLPDLNWAGFYLLQDDILVLGPFQGRPACIEIPLGKGVCGTAASEGQTLRVQDVHQFPGHIACDSASNSEIVIPIYRGSTLTGVLDLDSPLLSRFSPEDQAGLERFVEILQETVFA